MARAAAIVDVDRTLLTGRAGRILRDALHRTGVAVPPGPLGPAVDAATTASLSMQLSLLAAQASRGWPDDGVREAATAAAEAVVDDVAPYLRPLLDDHRSAGGRLLLVSAAPPAVAEPLGELLGVEDVVGTTWAEGRGLLASIEGPLVWARFKADAAAAWFRSARLSPRGAHAYADNFFAGPLLDFRRSRHGRRPRRPPDRAGPDDGLADPAPRRPRWCLQGGRAGAPGMAPALCPRRGGAERPHRDRRPGARPRPGRGDPRLQPPQLLRRGRRRSGGRPGGTRRSGASARRRCSTRPSSAYSLGRSGRFVSTGAPAPTSLSKRRPWRCGPARW